MWQVTLCGEDKAQLNLNLRSRVKFIVDIDYDA